MTSKVNLNKIVSASKRHADPATALVRSMLEDCAPTVTTKVLPYEKQLTVLI